MDDSIVLPSGMFSTFRTPFSSNFAAGLTFSGSARLIAFTIALSPAFVFSQNPAAPQPSMRDRIMARILGNGTSAWTPAQLATMGKLRDAAIADPYALDELRHLTDNIGPRLSGSPQAQQAVEYVAAEMRALGAEVTLEKTSVPHWVRGAETGALV